MICEHYRVGAMSWSAVRSVVPSATILLILGAICSAGNLPAQAPSQRPAQLRGLVRTQQEVPVPDAEISLLGTTYAARTDSVGRFVVLDIPPGEYVVRVRRIGFQAQDLGARLSAGENKEVTIVLSEGLVQLPEITVTARSAKPIEYANTAKYDEFFRRRAVGLGRYLSRRDIEKKSASRTVSLLAGLPGVRVMMGVPGTSPTKVWFRACMQVSVWVDGWVLSPVARSPGEVAEVLDRVHPLSIEMIEVYDSPAVMQAEFLGDSCAAIVIWTR